VTTFNEYMEATRETAVYPDAMEGTVDAILYVGLGLASEAGEVAGELKRIVRDDAGTVTLRRTERLVKEIGDALWYAARLADELDLDLDDIAETNIARLLERKKHGTLKGEGDDR
jgi:NTP pyrophosphatase (non-canonical NTP hydrolase)